MPPFHSTHLLFGEANRFDYGMNARGIGQIAGRLPEEEAVALFAE